MDAATRTQAVATGHATRTHPETVVVTPPANLDMYAAADFKRTLIASLGRRPEVLALDMSQVTHLDALPLAVVARARQEAAQHGTQLVVVGIHGQPRALLEEWAPNPPLASQPDA